MSDVTPHDQDSVVREKTYALAAALRDAIDRLVNVEASEDDLERALAAAKLVAASLSGSAARRWYERDVETRPQDSLSEIGRDASVFMDRSPMMGLANPLSPPMRFTWDEDDRGRYVRGDGRFGSAYEGAPGCVHGGVLASAFDEALGLAVATTGQPGMTGTLTVRYRQPTPLHTDLRFSARAENVTGRKIHVSATCHGSAGMTAEAEAVFIAIDFQAMRSLSAPGGLGG